MMIDHIEYENNQVVVNKILAAFPDNAKMSDIRFWLPLHCAMALFIQNKISEEDVRILCSADPAAMHQFSEQEQAGQPE
jgi:hypothetical protein